MVDYLPHPFQVMDEIVSVAKGETVVLVDGGFRRGSDAFKGLAFGATLVGTWDQNREVVNKGDVLWTRNSGFWEHY